MYIHQQEASQALYLLLHEQNNRPLVVACQGLPVLVSLMSSASEFAKVCRVYERHACEYMCEEM